MSENYNLFLNSKENDPLRSFRQRPYIWDSSQASESQAFRDRMHRQYRFPSNRPVSPKQVYVPHVLDHNIESRKPGFEVKSAPETLQTPLRWQADFLHWLFVVLGLLILLMVLLAMVNMFGGIVGLVLIFLPAWYCVEKVLIFLNSEIEVVCKEGGDFLDSENELQL